MNCLQDQQNCRYLQFLLLLCGLLLMLAFGNGYFQLQQTRQLLLQQQQTMVSALLAQKVDAAIITQALCSTDTTTAGKALLQQLGFTKQLPLWLFPGLQEKIWCFLLLPLFGILGCCALLLGCSFHYLRQRNQLYQQATAVVTAFADEDFSRHLPRGLSGTLYQLFVAVDHLAMALQAKIELETKQKLFLQDTISDISHQLKTPLAALSMYTEIMAAAPHNPTAIQMFTEKSAQSIQRMERLIQTLLKIMRLDAGTILFEKQCHPVLELVSQAAAQHWTRAQQEQKQIFLSGDPQAQLLCDLDWTSEALSNLIKNALDHTAAGGIIQINWQCSPAMLRLTIADNGTGIAEEDLHHIFKRFYRSKQASNQQGAGLGLPLAKAIVEGQGGILSVQSTPREGAIFTLSFLTEL